MAAPTIYNTTITHDTNGASLTGDVTIPASGNNRIVIAAILNADTLRSAINPSMTSQLAASTSILDLDIDSGPTDYQLNINVWFDDDLPSAAGTYSISESDNFEDSVLIAICLTNASQDTIVAGQVASNQTETTATVLPGAFGTTPTTNSITFSFAVGEYDTTEYGNTNGTVVYSYSELADDVTYAYQYSVGGDNIGWNETRPDFIVGSLYINGSTPLITTNPILAGSTAGIE